MEEHSIVQFMPSQVCFGACVDTIWQPVVNVLQWSKPWNFSKFILENLDVRNANNKAGINRATQLSSMVGFFYKMHTLWTE